MLDTHTTTPETRTPPRDRLAGVSRSPRDLSLLSQGTSTYLKRSLVALPTPCRALRRSLVSFPFPDIFSSHAKEGGRDERKDSPRDHLLGSAKPPRGTSPYQVVSPREALTHTRTLGLSRLAPRAVRPPPHRGGRAPAAETLSTPFESLVSGSSFPADFAKSVPLAAVSLDSR